MSAMTSKERVKRAFAHQEPDRVPLFELTIDNPTAERVLGRRALCGFAGWSRGQRQNQALREGTLPDYYRQRTQDTIDLWRALDLDVCPATDLVSCNPTVPEQLDPVTWRFTDRATGQWEICRYGAESDTYDAIDGTLKQDGLPALEALTAHLEAHPVDPDSFDWSYLDRIVAELGERDGRFIMCHADVQIGSTYYWAEHFLMGLVDAPDLINRYLDARLRDTLILLDVALQHGIDGVYGGYDWAGNAGPVFSPRHFRQFVFPRLAQIAALCHRYGVPYVKHTDGNIHALLDDIIAAGVDGFQAIEPRAGMDIAQLKLTYGDRLTLIGNVDCSTVLVHGPVEAVRAQTEAVIRAAAPGGGFLLSTSNSVHPGVKPELYLAMLETARAVGVYPLA